MLGDVIDALIAERDAALQELERRTAWHNEQMRELTLERDILKADYDALAREHDIVQAELRKYEPSDGMMHQLLALNTAIAEAATMLCDGYNIDASADWKNFHERVQAWLALPVVVHARKRHGPAATSTRNRGTGHDLHERKSSR